MAHLDPHLPAEGKAALTNPSSGAPVTERAGGAEGDGDWRLAVVPAPHPFDSVATLAPGSEDEQDRATLGGSRGAISVVRDSLRGSPPRSFRPFQPAGDEVVMASDGSHGNGSAETEKAKTQSLFREVNERMNEVSAQRASFDMPQDVICECAQPTCSERITMTAVEYAGLRSRSTLFVIAPLDEHFFPEVERVVANNGHWWIVEKDGNAGAVAEKLDPRKR